MNLDSKFIPDKKRKNLFTAASSWEVPHASRLRNQDIPNHDCQHTRVKAGHVTSSLPRDAQAIHEYLGVVVDHTEVQDDSNN